MNLGTADQLFLKVLRFYAILHLVNLGIIFCAVLHTVFDLSAEEWVATKELIDRAKAYVDSKYNPDGYNVGWNCGDAGGQDVFHAHLHIIPRHADEPFAGRGIRSWIKREENRRPQSEV